MGLTQRLGLLADVFQPDSSLNVGIGGAANASYKLAVTGTTLTTGAATFSSSVTAGARIQAQGSNGAGSTQGGFLINYNANASSRSWLINNDQEVFGDFSIMTSTTQTGSTYTSRLYINPSGNVGIGTSSPSYKLDISAVGYGIQHYADASNYLRTYCGSTYQIIEINGTNQFGYVGGNFFVQTAGTERMRITSGGNVLVGATTALGTNYKIQATGYAGFITNATNSGDAGFYSTSSTIGWHFYADNGTSSKFYVLNNGDVRNANNSYGAISDISLKENITNATPKLADLLKVKVRNYNLKADEKKEKQLGVIAQELEEVFPNMISEDKKMGSDETIKTVKYSVFVPMLIKAIQEQQEIINQLSAKVTALENR